MYVSLPPPPTYADELSCNCSVGSVCVCVLTQSPVIQRCYLMNHSLEITLRKPMNLKVCDFPMFMECEVIIRAVSMPGLSCSSSHTPTWGCPSGERRGACRWDDRPGQSSGKRARRRLLGSLVPAQVKPAGRPIRRCMCVNACVCVCRPRTAAVLDHAHMINPGDWGLVSFDKWSAKAGLCLQLKLSCYFAVSARDVTAV